MPYFEYSFDATAFNRVFLALYFTAVAVFYFALILYRKQKYQTKVVHIGKPFKTHWLNHSTFIFFRMAIWTTCVVRVFYVELDTFLVVQPTVSFILLLGDLLLIAGLALAIYTTMYLSNQWRSGIDNGVPQVLVTRGVFSLSRNPNFLGVLIAQLGFFLALPSLFTLLCLMVGWVSIGVQVRLEEKHLSQLHPNSYNDYIKTTPRWLNIKTLTAK